MTQSDCSIALRHPFPIEFKDQKNGDEKESTNFCHLGHLIFCPVSTWSPVISRIHFPIILPITTPPSTLLLSTMKSSLSNNRHQISSFWQTADSLGPKSLFYKSNEIDIYFICLVVAICGFLSGENETRIMIKDYRKSKSFLHCFQK